VHSSGIKLGLEFILRDKWVQVHSKRIKLGSKVRAEVKSGFKVHSKGRKKDQYRVLIFFLASSKQWTTCSDTMECMHFQQIEEFSLI
jgi:hypothetical protein